MITVTPREMEVADFSGDLTKKHIYVDNENDGIVVGATERLTLQQFEDRYGVTQLIDLSDVNTATPTNRYVLVADGVDWESRLLTETDISDLQSYLIASNDLSDLNNAATARTNLGLVIGTDVQAQDQNLQDIADLAPGAGNDGEALTWDDGTSAFVLSAVSSLVADTRDNLIATSPGSDTLGYATDTKEFLIYDLSNTEWRIAPLELDAADTTPDIGAYTPDGLGVSDKSGYYRQAISDKVIYHSVVGANDLTVSGGVRTSSETFQHYADGAWNDIVTGFRFREDDTDLYKLEHKPIGLDEWYEVMSGDSADLFDINGLPVVQQYQSTIGPHQPKMIISGGTF